MKSPIQLPAILRAAFARISAASTACCILTIAFLASGSAGTLAAANGADEPPAAADEPQPADGGLRDESDQLDPGNKDAIAWYMAGQKALRGGQLDEAVEAFKKSSEADPKSAVPVRALATVLFRQGSVEEALRTANKAIGMDQDDFLTRLELAVLLGSNGRLPDAAALIEQAVKSNRLKRESSDFVRVHQVRGAVMLQLRNQNAAVESFEILLAALEKPEEFGLSNEEHRRMLKNRGTSYETVGRVLLESGRLVPAITAFNAMSRLQKDVPGEHNLLLARALFQQDKLADCETNLNKYFETGRRSPESLTLLRDLFENSDRRGKLAKRLEELADNADQPGQVRLFLGQLLLDEGKPSEAAEVFQLVLDTTGEADANLGMVRVEIARRDADGVIAALNRAARARITPAEFTPLIAGLTTVDDFGKATVSECLKTFNDQPGDLEPGVTWFCSQVAGELELEKEQAELLKATLELEPDGELLLDTLDKYGVSQLQLGEGKLAVRIFEQLLAQPGLAPGARINTLFRLSIAYGMNDDLKSARRALNEALKMVPNEPQLLARLALIEAEEGRFDQAEAILIQAIGALQQTGNTEMLIETRIRLAGIYFMMQRWDSAAEQYETVLEMEDLPKPTRRLARMGLSNVWTQSGEMAKGEAILEEVYKEDPNDPGVNNDLGYLYADQGKNLEQAEKMIRIAVAAEGDNPSYLDSLGWVLFKLGRLEEALEFQKKAVEIPNHDDSTLLEHLGDIHEALKQPDEARKLWQQALELEQKDKRPDKTVIERLEGKLKPASR
jgi:tetratricopeptide (TPR) repeat protein